MAVQWTENQQDAINARRGTVLVAAAAGSGKTAVLVQRAIERLTDPEHPTAADRMLIVTFTKAAAAEMRARLEKRLYEMLRADPGNDLLRRQSILLSQAHIGTVDSFCAEMVREFFYALDISPEFKIVTDKQREELMEEAVGEALSESFEAGSCGELADAFTAERDDRKLAEMVLTLYEYMQSHPFPENWLREKCAMYREAERAGDSPWGRVILSYLGEAAEYCRNLAKEALSAMEADEKMAAAYAPAFESDLVLIEALARFAREKDWDGACRALSGAKFQSMKALRGYDGDPLKDRVRAMRDEIKDAVKKLMPMVSPGEEDCLREFRETGVLVESLAGLTLDFAARFQQKKQERNFLDYGDLEHFALRLFLDENGERTGEAREVSARFDEIMIDEYQDINEVQDSLFRAVSDEGNNLFMVGDVKQSIYGFRQAKPELFLRCRERFSPYDREREQYPAYIVLDRNFRSRSTVTESVNFVFSQIMTKSAGDIDYNGGEELVCAAPYEEKPGCELQMDFLARDSETPAELAEAAHIADLIQSMLAEGFTVTARDGERPAQFGDFCILLRSANKYAYSYAQELQRRGVPARASVAGGFFAAPEVAVMLSLLRVIDNPNQDIPLLAVLMSPIYGFTPDDMARLRMESRGIPVYLSVVRAAADDPRCARVMEEIGRYRAVAATMPSDAFISFLYGKTGYTDMALAMKDGESRLSNLRLLQKYAREYENSGFSGISGFVRFLDRLRESDSDLQAAESSSGGENAVKVMSIHKSKGLEFPVCIVAGCGRKNVAERGEVLLHPELGLGVKLKEQRLSARFTTMAREAIALETARSAAAEELRVLYVAMTRAKEKLILVGSMLNPQRELAKLASQVTERGISPFVVRNAKSAAQWLMLCALRHPNADLLRELAGADSGGGIICREHFTPWHVRVLESPPALPDEVQADEEPAAPDRELYARMKRRLDFRYPFAEENGIPTKVAASKLAARQRGAGEEFTLSRPAWLGAEGMTPAERGIALHDYMQYADFAAAAKDPQAELARLVEKAFLTPEQAQAVDMSRVRKFFGGETGQRVLAADWVQKERRFTAEIPAELAVDGLPQGCAGLTVTLQGAVDCLFFADGKLHIIDFKTDRVKSTRELWELYGPQISLYAHAMEQVTREPVGELILYSMHLGTGEAHLFTSRGRASGTSPYRGEG